MNRRSRLSIHALFGLCVLALLCCAGATLYKVVHVADELERRLGKPVLTANQVTTWHALELVGEKPTLSGRGRLFGSS